MSRQNDIAREIDEAVTKVLNESRATDAFKAQFRGLIRNALIDNLGDRDLDRVVDAAPSQYAEGT